MLHLDRLRTITSTLQLSINTTLRLESVSDNRDKATVCVRMCDTIHPNFYSLQYTSASFRLSSKVDKRSIHHLLYGKYTDIQHYDITWGNDTRAEGRDIFCPKTNLQNEN